jgi:hypothetical protein
MDTKFMHLTLAQGLHSPEAFTASYQNLRTLQRNLTGSIKLLTVTNFRNMDYLTSIISSQSYFRNMDYFFSALPQQKRWAAFPAAPTPSTFTAASFLGAVVCGSRISTAGPQPHLPTPYLPKPLWASPGPFASWPCPSHTWLSLPDPPPSSPPARSTVHASFGR